MARPTPNLSISNRRSYSTDFSFLSVTQMHTRKKESPSALIVCLTVFTCLGTCLSRVHLFPLTGALAVSLIIRLLIARTLGSNKATAPNWPRDPIHKLMSKLLKELSPLYVCGASTDSLNLTSYI